jgi:hypothetical protein
MGERNRKAPTGIWVIIEFPGLIGSIGFGLKGCQSDDTFGRCLILDFGKPFSSLLGLIAAYVEP